MIRRSRSALAAALSLFVMAGCAKNPSPAARPPAAGAPTGAPVAGAAAGDSTGGRTAGAAAGPRAYNRVITSAAVTKSGLFKAHMIAEKLFFEIPRRELNRDMLILGRTVEGGATTGFFGGGPQAMVVWQREGTRILLRERPFSIRADSSQAIYRAVSAMNEGAIIASFNIEAWGPDSAAVIDATRLFTTNISEIAGVNAVVADRSFINTVAAFPSNVNIEATQTGTAVATPGAPPGARPRTITARMIYSMLRLPEQPMRPRLSDARVGINSISYIDYGRPEHEAKERRFIRRYRLEKKNPGAAVSDPVTPIVFYIDPATPEWLVPFMKQGVNDWRPAFEAAGFSNAIEAREAPSKTEDPDWSPYDARYNIIYWRPSNVSNATGGQVADPRTGEILKAEVNMYHNVMNLVRNWYFTQVGPLDPRAQQLPLPDPLMGRLVQYVAAHEVGHAIGFPHNMKASSQYPADSLRSATFLRRMGGHVSTLMDYSRFNYVAQPEDNIPVDLLIPGVGPYDFFAIMWQNKPIEGARTPDEEWTTLNAWSRMQDTIPWFRWSTSSATGDPGNLTEAVGDQDAVKSSTLGLRNLRRVSDMLIRVAEKPGEDYSLLTDLYQNTVDQWSRYNSHVAAIVAGAVSQERYGTGIRFVPESEARQKGAIQFLTENAFTVPGWLVNRDILWRIEQEGGVARIRAAQSGVLNTLLAPARLSRLIEYEALTAPGTNHYTLGEMLRDVRRGVWTELSATRPQVDVYRRGLQRAYLDAVGRTVRPAPATGPVVPGAAPAGTSDARPALRGELMEIDREVAAALGRTTDAMTRLHLQDVRLEIKRLLDPGN